MVQMSLEMNANKVVCTRFRFKQCSFCCGCTQCTELVTNIKERFIFSFL